MQKLRVIRTLIFIEILSRPGLGGMYLLSSLLQPMVMLITFAFLISHFQRDIGYGGNIFLFLVTGLLPHFATIQTTNRVMNTYTGWRKNKKLPGMAISDLVIARTLLDFSVFIIIALIFLYGAYFVAYAPHPPQDIMNILIAFVLLGMLSIGAGSFSMGAGRIFAPWLLLIAALQRLLFFLSGAFYVVDYIPVAFRDVVVYNPIAHGGMLIRLGYYGEKYPHITLSVSYLFWWALMSMFFGLLLERLTRPLLRKREEGKLGEAELD